jgi:uncharacterized membrane protein
MLAIDPLSWPGMNQAFLTSFGLTLLMVLAAFLYGRRRDPGARLTWGGAMLASVYLFAVFFLAFGVVPHQWLDHADKELGWRKDKLLLGPFDILKPDTQGGSFPITISYQEVRDVIVVLIHVVFIGLFIWFAAWWQKRGRAKPAPELEVSTYGRPLVRKA